MHFLTWVLALWLPIALQLSFKSLETVIDLLIILTNCLNRLQNRNYTLTMVIEEDKDPDAALDEPDEFYRRLNKMNEQVKETYNLNETNNNQENQEEIQEQYYKEMEEMQEQVNKLSQLQDKELQDSHDSTPEEYKDIDTIVAKVNSVNNKIYIDESLE